MSIITPESEIEELHLSEDTEKCLRDAGIKFVGDLLEVPGAELRAYCDNSAYAEIKARLGERKGHFMPSSLLPSQFEALEEPRDAITIDVSDTPPQIVDAIRKRLAI